MKSFSVFCLANILAFLASLGLAYFAGRSGKITFVGAHLAAAVVSFVVASVLAFALKIKPFIIKLAIPASTIIVQLMVYGVAPDAMMRSYVSGFQNAVLNAANVTQWELLLQNSGEYFAQDSTNRASNSLPEFVRRVYPTRKPYTAFTLGDSNDERDVRLSVWWRDVTLCIGLDIGAMPPRQTTVYQATLSNKIHIVVFRDQ